MLFDIFVIMSFMSFGCDVPSSLTDRATITLNMVLTAAAFKISISSQTPQIGASSRQTRGMRACGMRARHPL